MKFFSLRALAALSTVAAAALFAPVARAQEAEAPAEADPGLEASVQKALSSRDFVDLARIVNAAGGWEETTNAVVTVVSDVLAELKGDERIAAVDALAATLSAAAVATGGEDLDRTLAMIVDSLAAAGGPDAVPFAEHAAAVIAASTGLSAFSGLVSDPWTQSAKDAAADPSSVLSAKDIVGSRELHENVVAILTPGEYETQTDIDVVTPGGQAGGAPATGTPAETPSTGGTAASTPKQPTPPPTQPTPPTPPKPKPPKPVPPTTKPSPTPTGLR